MKRILSFVLTITLLVSLSSCTKWLEVYPQNDQVSDYYWKSKEDVEAMLNGAYSYMRSMVTSRYLPLGELRAGQLFTRRGNDLQSFRIKIYSEYANWGPFYEVINVANGVIANAHKALEQDDTYDENTMRSHLAEAYFLRAYNYFYLIRNWQAVPLILQPYEDDSQAYLVAASSEEEVIKQIKADLTTAIESGAAKEHFDKLWENKGRATKWALYALMADVCLWSGDYAAAESYCDELLNASSSYAPHLLTSPTHASWFSMFNPGNSNESILELQWEEEEDQLNELPFLFDNSSATLYYEFSEKMIENFQEEYRSTISTMQEAVRSLYGGFYVPNAASFEAATSAYVWKYFGSEVLTEKRTSEHYDPNFILYRMAEIYLMHAEALTMQGPSRWAEAVADINLIRRRSNLSDCLIDPAAATQADLLECILDERAMELCGEGKAWYDMLRMARRNNYEHKDRLLVNRVLEYNKQASSSWLRSVLRDNNALYLPIWEKELEYNTLLVQNPYYK